MSKHTPGKLSVDWMMAGYGREARRMEVINADGHGAIGLAYSPEDARRLVACWNACAGLSTEALERGALEEFLNLIETEKDRTIREALTKLRASDPAKP